MTDATRTTWRWLELGVVFFAAPTAFWLAREAGYRIPVIPAILGLALTVGILARIDPSFRFATAWRSGWSGAELRRVLLWFACGASVLAIGTALALPERFLSFPRQRPEVWLLVMVFYPLLSVLPQEFAFRTFFFHRYREILPTPTARITTSAAAFGWAHVAFGHWLSVALSTIGGVLFALSYARTGSIRLIWIEHGLYGCFVFTVGLGRFFYGGATTA